MKMHAGLRDQTTNFSSPYYKIMVIILLYQMK